MKKLNRLLYLLAFLKFVLPFFLQSSVYEPHRDEFLYLAEGGHPAFGFMEVPPLLSVFAWITRHLGNTHVLDQMLALPIRGTQFYPGWAKSYYQGVARAFSLFLLFCCFIFSAFIRVHFLFQPNFLEIFFYTLIGYGLIRYIQTTQNKWLYVVALAAGFGLLSKYSVAFYLVSLIPALLITRQRAIFS